MRALFIILGMVGLFFLGALFEVKVLFPVIKEQVRQEGYLAGVRAQADNVCQVLWSPEYRAILGEDGFIENCVMRGMD